MQKSAPGGARPATPAKNKAGQRKRRDALAEMSLTGKPVSRAFHRVNLQCTAPTGTVESAPGATRTVHRQSAYRRGPCTAAGCNQVTVRLRRQVPGTAVIANLSLPSTRKRRCHNRNHLVPPSQSVEGREPSSPSRTTMEGREPSSPSRRGTACMPASTVQGRCLRAQCLSATSKEEMHG